MTRVKTYLLYQILFHSVSGPYLLTNLPWLIGSLGIFQRLQCKLTADILLGTIGEDLIIFIQFRIFKDRRHEADDSVVE